MNETSDTAAKGEAGQQQHLSERTHEDCGHTSEPLLDDVVLFYEWPVTTDESDSIQGVVV